MITLLVADDEDIVRSFIRTVIEKERLPVSRILEADNGLETVRLALEHNPDLILLDIRMPGLNGLKACSAIHEKLPDADIVIVSAYGEFDYAREALTSGARDYLLKPVSRQQLAELITRFSERRRQEAGMSLAETQTHPLVEKVTEYVRLNMAQQINLADLARAVFVSPTHLSHKFKKITGQPVSLYIQRLRVTRAVELLADPALTVTDIAGLVGFNNPGYFATCFKTLTGQTPSQYRQKTAAGISKG